MEYNIANFVREPVFVTLLVGGCQAFLAEIG
jgi:hypothetical protein